MEELECRGMESSPALRCPPVTRVYHHVSHHSSASCLRVGGRAHFVPVESTHPDSAACNHIIMIRERDQCLSGTPISDYTEALIERAVDVKLLPQCLHNGRSAAMLRTLYTTLPEDRLEPTAPQFGCVGVLGSLGKHRSDARLPPMWFYGSALLGSIMGIFCSRGGIIAENQDTSRSRAALDNQEQGRFVPNPASQRSVAYHGYILLSSSSSSLLPCPPTSVLSSLPRCSSCMHAPTAIAVPPKPPRRHTCAAGLLAEAIARNRGVSVPLRCSEAACDDHVAAADQRQVRRSRRWQAEGTALGNRDDAERPKSYTVDGDRCWIILSSSSVCESVWLGRGGRRHKLTVSLLGGPPLQPLPPPSPPRSGLPPPPLSSVHSTLSASLRYPLASTPRHTPKPSTTFTSITMSRIDLPYCWVCLKVFTRKQDVRRHWNEDHNPLFVGYPCTYDGCGKKYKQESQLDYHISTKHTLIPTKICPDCGEAFLNAPKLSGHRKDVHGRKAPHTKAYEAKQALKKSGKLATARTKHRSSPYETCSPRSIKNNAPVDEPSWSVPADSFTPSTPVPTFESMV
ncbi:hypothetical protein EVG20_g11609, partial [Dentipellis fragilis]